MLYICTYTYTYASNYPSFNINPYINRNNLKVRYSCIPNISSIIKLYKIFETPKKYIKLIAALKPKKHAHSKGEYFSSSLAFGTTSRTYEASNNRNKLNRPYRTYFQVASKK